MASKIDNNGIYSYKGNEYEIVMFHDNAVDTASLVVKDSNDASWYPAVLYCPVNEPHVRYCRREDDFLAKFKLIGGIVDASDGQNRASQEPDEEA